jgi:hypothetical protein
MGLHTRLIGAAALACVIGISSALAAAPSVKAPLTVKSTLDGKRILPLRIHWVARAHSSSSPVDEVDFLIDGKVGWIEHKPPYYYGSDRNWLVTTWLKPGIHRFTVRAVTRNGRRASRTTKARILPAPPPPTELAGTWSRTVAQGDLGTWRVTINRIGWLFDDPEGGGQNQDVSYPAPGQVLIRAAIEKPIFGRYKRGGAFCNHEPDPPGLYAYSVSGDGDALTLKAVRNDCRKDLLQGTWTRIR